MNVPTERIQSSATDPELISPYFFRHPSSVLPPSFNPSAVNTPALYPPPMIVIFASVGFELCSGKSAAQTWGGVQRGIGI